MNEQPKDYSRNFPEGTKRITTGCQYCAVGCGYNAFLIPEGAEKPDQPTTEGVSRFITPAMTNKVRFQGNPKPYDIAVAPDVRCDLNKGNHSVRGGSQGENLITADGSGRSTRDRLKSPMVRLADGRLHEITWDQMNEVMARLVVKATGMKIAGNKIKVSRPEGLGVKIYEYQYLENTYAATKLFYSAIGTPNVAYHDRPSAAGSSPGLEDVGFRPHDFSYDDVRHSDVLLFIGTNPYENQSVFFMQYCAGKEIIVIDPRKTATAQYAEQTGGLHLQPTKLGSDSLVLYALARAIIELWTSKNHRLEDFPLRAETGANVNDLPVTDEDLKKQAEKRRRASRALSFEAFAKEFLEEKENGHLVYDLENAFKKSGIPEGQLQEAAKRLFDPTKTTLSEQSRVAILYEKGMIWGFNYHNTAAVGSLGLLLGAYSEPGRLVGRVGGHQKGWAEARQPVDVFAKSSGEGYPFRNAKDQYFDNYLEALRKRNPDRIEEETIPVHHNLDNHVFGVPPDLIETALPGGKVKLTNGLITKKNPDVRLLWIIGNNYLGQTNDGDRKRNVLVSRLKKGGKDKKILRPAARSPAESITTDEIVEALAGRIDKSGIILIHQDLFENPTTNHCDLVIPAAGWGEDTFCRYNAQRRLKLYDRFQDMPLHENDAGAGDPLKRVEDFQHSPKPDWLIFRDVAHKIGWLMDGGHEGDLFDKLKTAFPWQDSSALADEMAQYSHRQEMLGVLHKFGKNHIPAADGIVHSVLGKQAGGESAYLKEPPVFDPRSKPCLWQRHRLKRRDATSPRRHECCWTSRSARRHALR